VVVQLCVAAVLRAELSNSGHDTGCSLTRCPADPHAPPGVPSWSGVGSPAPAWSRRRCPPAGVPGPTRTLLPAPATPPPIRTARREARGGLLGTGW